MRVFNNLKRSGKGALQLSIKARGNQKATNKSQKALYAFVSNFSVYNCQFQIAISPRFLSQIGWNNPY